MFNFANEIIFWTSGSHLSTWGSRWNYNNLFQMIHLNFWFIYSTAYFLPLILEKLIYQLIISPPNFILISNYLFKIFLNRWRCILIILSQYSYTIHLSVLYWSNWNMDNIALSTSPFTYLIIFLVFFQFMFYHFLQFRDLIIGLHYTYGSLPTVWLSLKHIILYIYIYFLFYYKF